MARETILVTGASGQLGNEFKKISPAYPEYDFLFVTKEELAIDEHEQIRQFFAANTIHFCINCAAYTAVDKAETEKEKAFLINAGAVAYLAAVCKDHNVKFFHISTDYVFDGSASSPYKEDHPVNPVNLYGASKLKGEELALGNNPDTIIIRTSWLYSSFGNNFVKTMLRLMREKDSINVVSDQLGSPTYAADLAVTIMDIIRHTVPRFQSSTIFNYSNSGSTSWHGFALAIKKISGSTCLVNPIPASQYPTPAKRPAYSVMDTSKLQQTFGITIPLWKDSLESCMKLLLENKRIP